MIQGIKEHVFSVLRDLVYINNEMRQNRIGDAGFSESITNAVFHILRNAGLMRPGNDPKLIVCWGGHSIN